MKISACGEHLIKSNARIRYLLLICPISQPMFRFVAPYCGTCWLHPEVFEPLNFVAFTACGIRSGADGLRQSSSCCDAWVDRRRLFCKSEKRAAVQEGVRRSFSPSLASPTSKPCFKPKPNQHGALRVVRTICYARILTSSESYAKERLKGTI